MFPSYLTPHKKRTVGGPEDAASIDDFLCDYRPQLMDVHDFMSFSEHQLDPSSSLHSAEYDKHSFSAPSYMVSDVGDAFHQSNQPLIQNVLSAQYPAVATQPGKRLSRSIFKRTYTKSSAETKDARRREQNREAQRRFRAKQICRMHYPASLMSRQNAIRWH